MQAISELFEQTTILITRKSSPCPAGALPLVGHNLIVTPLDEPRGNGLLRKLHLLLWLPRHIRTLWKSIRKADAVHALVPGDVGLIGICLSLLQKKKLFVRHCGTWGKPDTVFDHLTFWLLEKIANNRNIVFATGGGEKPPSPKNPNIKWIFSTTLTDKEISEIKIAKPWRPDDPLRLVNVSRLSKGKNIKAVIEAMSALLDSGLDVYLDVVGDGEERENLEVLVNTLQIGNRVVFYGTIPHKDVLELLSKSHIFVFPTRVNEGFPKAVLEAMAAGLPIVSSNVSVLPYLVSSGCGVILQNTSPSSISHAIKDLIAEPKLIEDMGRIGNQAAKQYSLENWKLQIKNSLENQWKIVLLYN